MPALVCTSRSLACTSRLCALASVPAFRMHALACSSRWHTLSCALAFRMPASACTSRLRAFACVLAILLTSCKHERDANTRGMQTTFFCIDTMKPKLHANRTPPSKNMKPQKELHHTAANQTRAKCSPKQQVELASRPYGRREASPARPHQDPSL